MKVVIQMDYDLFHLEFDNKALSPDTSLTTTAYQPMNLQVSAI